MPADQAARPFGRPMPRLAIHPTGRAFLIGILVGLAIGVVLGVLISAALRMQPRWIDANAGWTRLPDQTAVGTLPQTVTLPPGSYDFGGVGAPLPADAATVASIVKVEVQAQTGLVGVSLSRPDGGELISREAVVSPQQGKATLYFHVNPGMGAADVLLRAADNNPAGASATITRVQVAHEADIGQGELTKINRAGVY
jgi:hypothetical protein